MDREIPGTNRKALKINLDESVYGSFAEIGGGQEVARNFFMAGGASGTIAKTISAYDKVYSDAIYHNNQPGRYVSEERLISMLKTEYDELTGLLGEKRDENTRFFAFANTVTTLNYKKNNEGHGWLGIRFQLKPGCPFNQVVMHVWLLENDTLLQQNTLGILGVNLIHACYFYHQGPRMFLESLLDNLSPDRVEIDMVRMEGPDLEYVDNRLLAVQMVKTNMTKATMFDRHGQVQQPSEMLYKKNVLAFRGSFRPITYVGFDMLKSSYSLFKKDEDYSKENTMAFCEMTLNNLLDEGEIDEKDFLMRVDLLNGMGQNVMVSNFREYYRLVEYFSQFQIMKLRIVIGIPTFINVLEKKYYTHLKGGILEAMGKLFPDNMKLYVYPAIDENTGEMITSHNVPFDDDLKYLYAYLTESRKILDIHNVKKEFLQIRKKNIMDLIRSGKEGWERMVPRYIEKQIKQKNLFGYPGDPEKINYYERPSC